MGAIFAVSSSLFSRCIFRSAAEFTTMTLSCRNTNETLHRRGREVLTEYLHSGGVSSVYKPAANRNDEPVIPAPELFQHKALAEEKSSTAGLPTVSECAIHLELLETFFVLREKILRSDDIDKAMGISRKRETKTGYSGDTKTLKDDTFETRRREKWPKYVEFAVARFLAWRAELSGMKRPEDIASFRYNLPSLDVLMVWHAFLLNPLLFNKHCRTELIYDLPFPWQRIHDCINSRDWSFQLPADDTTQTTPLFDLFTNWEALVPNASCTLPSATRTTRTSIFTTLAPKSTTPTGPSLLLPAFTFTSCPSPATVASLPTPLTQHTAMFRAITTNPTTGALATALRDAVIRQTSFIDKMNSNLWIRSPSVSGTLRRAIERYSNFLLLMRRNPGTMLVPTLDIDLAWHTHQCAGRGYVVSVKERVGRFVNHDDDLEKGTLDSGSGDTRRLWRLGFGGEYRRCGCWDCEALVEELEIEGKEKGGRPDMPALAKRVDEKVGYYRAVEAARRKGRALPMRPKGL